MESKKRSSRWYINYFININKNLWDWRKIKITNKIRIRLNDKNSWWSRIKKSWLN